MNSIEMTNKSILDNLLEKFVVDNPKELEFAIEALKRWGVMRGLFIYTTLKSE
jgi:hypothetical protein